MTSALVVRCSVLDVQPVRAIERSKVILEGIKPIGDSLAFPSILIAKPMKTQVFRQIISPSTIFLYLAIAATCQTTPCLYAVTELENLVSLAMKQNPRVETARQLVVRAKAKHDGVSGFFDPRVVGAGGGSDRTRDIPGAIHSYGVSDNVLMAELGVEIPLRPGVYVTCGLAERYLMEPGSDYDSMYQSMIGAGMWIPLARDRLFTKWRNGKEQALKEVDATSHHLMAVIQSIRHQVELGYIEFLYALADEEVVKAAITRAEGLLEETRELVRLKVIPEYQLFPARMEVTLHREEMARTKHESRRRHAVLTELVGQTEPLALEGNALTFITWATNVDHAVTESVSMEDACRNHGMYMEVLSQIQSAEAGKRVAQEDIKPEIGLALSVSWQGEDIDSAIGHDLLISEDHLGTEAAIVWKQTLGSRWEKSNVRAKRAQIKALRQELNSLRLRIATNLTTARDAIESARIRLKFAAATVEDASKTLAAEAERFRLGEGRSRNVLDAQKDLTTSIRRRNRAAAAALNARYDFLYSSGYSAGNALTQKKQAQKTGGDEP